MSSDGTTLTPFAFSGSTTASSTQDGGQALVAGGNPNGICYDKTRDILYAACGIVNGHNSAFSGAGGPATSANILSYPVVTGTIGDPGSDTTFDDDITYGPRGADSGNAVDAIFGWITNVASDGSKFYLTGDINPVYIGSSSAENFVVSVLFSMTITGGGGGDKFTIIPVDSDVTTTITDFNNGVSDDTAPAKGSGDVE
eukprot:gene37403-46145_t